VGGPKKHKSGNERYGGRRNAEDGVALSRAANVLTAGRCFEGLESYRLLVRQIE
jgi:hypothetical protein